jgi:hypothetical protein
MLGGRLRVGGEEAADFGDGGDFGGAVLGFVGDLFEGFAELFVFGDGGLRALFQDALLQGVGEAVEHFQARGGEGEADLRDFRFQ